MLKAVLGLAGKFKARMKSQSGDDLIVSTSERSSQLNAPVSINFTGKKSVNYQPGCEIIHFGGQERRLRYYFSLKGRKVMKAAAPYSDS